MYKRVLSIQSHVVHGNVGNKCAVLPLQLLGYDVDAINSVQFSNHTQYEHITGMDQVLSASQLKDLFNGLEKNGILHEYSHVLTGYCGDPGFLLAIKDIVLKLRSINPNLRYVCDPVMGDYIANDEPKMYVPQSLLDVYRDHILPIADIVVPNQYEAELLSGVKVQSELDAWTMIDKLHQFGPNIVILSSTRFGNKDSMICLASQHVKPNNLGSDDRNSNKRYRLEFRRLSDTFTGAGDLFSACFLAWMDKLESDLKRSIELTIATLQSILEETSNFAHEIASEQNPTMSEMELRLVQNIPSIMHPTVEFRASLVDN